MILRTALAQRARLLQALMGRADTVPPDGSMRFIIEIPRSVIDALIFLHRYLRFDQRDDVRAILAALDRLGHRPTITPIG